MLEPHKQWFEGCGGIHGPKDRPFFRVSLLQRQNRPLFSPTPPAAAQLFIQSRGCYSLFLILRGRWIHSTCYLLSSCVCAHARVCVRVHFLSSLFSSIILPLSTCWYGRGFIPLEAWRYFVLQTVLIVCVHTLPSRLLLTSRKDCSVLDLLLSCLGSTVVSVLTAG